MTVAATTTTTTTVTIDTDDATDLFTNMYSALSKKALLALATHLNNNRRHPYADAVSNTNTRAEVLAFVVRCSISALKRTARHERTAVAPRTRAARRVGLGERFSQHCYLEDFVCHRFTAEDLPIARDAHWNAEKRALRRAANRVIKYFDDADCTLAVGRASHANGVYEAVLRRFTTTYSHAKFVGCVILLTDVLVDGDDMSAENTAGRANRLTELEKALHAHVSTRVPKRYFQTSATSACEGRAMRDTARNGCLYMMFTKDIATDNDDESD